MVRPSAVFLSLPAIMALVEAAPLPQPHLLQSRDQTKTKGEFLVLDNNANKDSQLGDVVAKDTASSESDAAIAIEHAPVTLQPRDVPTFPSTTSPAVVRPFTFSPPSEQAQSPEAAKKKPWYSTKRFIGAAVVTAAGLVCVVGKCRSAREVDYTQVDLYSEPGYGRSTWPG